MAAPLFSSLLAVLLFVSSTAQAGFEFVPPVGVDMVERAPVIVSAPQPKTEKRPVPIPLKAKPAFDPATGPIVLTTPPAVVKAKPKPSIQIRRTKADIPAPIFKEKKVEPLKMEDKVAVPAPAPIEIKFEPRPVAVTQPVTPVAPASKGLSINPYPVKVGGAASALSTVEGFGQDLPLVLALRQVVPPSYAFAFDEGLNPGASVSWRGGRAWDLVVADMVGPLGFKSIVHDQTVYIYRRAQ